MLLATRNLQLVTCAMRYIVILDSFLLLHQLQEITSAAKEVICLLTESSPLKKKFPKKIKIPGKHPLKDDTYKKLALNKDDRVIIHVSTTEITKKILACILKACDITPIVVLKGNTTGSPAICQESISYISINELLGKNVTREWSNITNRQRTSTIRNLTRDAENILILIQHDPDPDALASGLGLRHSSGGTVLQPL